MKKLLEEVIEKCNIYAKEGRVASYIPPLSKKDPYEFGITLINEKGETFSAGDSEKSFTMQSVVKPIILLRALIDKGEEKVENLVGVEATGKPFDAFNYSDQALCREHINPMINTGAIALCSLIDGKTYEEKFSNLLSLVSTMADNPSLDIDEEVYLSEKETGNKNRALAYMLKSYNMLEDDVEQVLDCYFKACSIKVTSEDLAKIGFMLAHKGKDILSGKTVCSREYARFVNAVLMTSGMYDGSGEFAVKVGIPAKSGVGGGIMAVVPFKMGIGIYSPALDSKGNSLAGIKALEMLSRSLDLSIF